jgi:hypothetical protein
LKILSDLLALWYPAGSRPRIIDVFIPRKFVPPAAHSLPPMIFIFIDSKIAAQVRSKLFSHIRATPDMRRCWIEPVLTLATHVRIEIMLAIRRILSVSVDRCSVQRTGHSPYLHVVSGGRDRVYGFVQSCELFGHYLTADLLRFAYRTAGRSFNNRLAATFLVLMDGAQPTANFFIPTPRVSAVVAASGSVAVAVGSTSSLDTSVPPPVVSTYLQRALSAPVPSGSGRKRPAEASETSSKRSAP